MARDFYETTIALPDAAGHVVALAGVKVSVVPRGASDVAGSLVDIFVADTGAAERANPVLTTANGAVRFWADGPAEYDLVFEDTDVPARVTDRIGWNAVPAKAGDVGTPALVSPGTITQAMLSPAVVYNEVPIGAVLDWWRPADSVDPPPGFVMCLGQSLAAGLHDFPIAGAINVPDLRHCFILGADEAKTDGTGASANDDVVGSAPGIRGTGGSNRHTLSALESGTNPSGSTDNDGAHQHVPIQGRNPGTSGTGGATTLLTYYADGVTSNFGSIPSDGSSHQHSFASRPADSPHNNMPKWYGLLKIMKVKR